MEQLEEAGSSGLAGRCLIYVTEKNAFCEDIDFGEVLIKGYVVNNKVGAVEIELQNGQNNDQSAKKVYSINMFNQVLER